MVEHKNNTSLNSTDVPITLPQQKSRVWKARQDVPKEKELIVMVNETCNQLGIKKPPKLFIFDDSRRQLSGAVGIINSYFFSQSALDTLSRDQLKAVVAHELTHRKHLARETTVGALGLAVFVPTMLILASINPVVAIPAMMGLLTALASGVLWYRRRMEREADLEGAEIAGPQAMINTLRVLEKQKDEIHSEKTKKLAKLVPPFLRLYPTIDERIQNIREHMPQKNPPDKQTEEEKSRNDREVAYYTVSAVQSGAISDKINAARALENTRAETPTQKPTSER